MHIYRGEDIKDNNFSQRNCISFGYCSAEGLPDRGEGFTTQFTMHLFFYVIHVTTMLAIVSGARSRGDGGCGVFGHSCLGGHGKRASIDLKPNIDDPSTRIWPNAVGQLASSRAVTPIQERLNTKPLQALELESVLVFNDIPRGAEHSRYLSQEDYDN